MLRRKYVLAVNDGLFAKNAFHCSVFNYFASNK